MPRFASALFVATLLSVGCVASPIPAQAQMSASMTQPTIQQETTLSLRGEGRVDASPDKATLSLGVSVEADTAQDAMRQQARQMDGVFRALKAAGVDDKDMQTGQLNLNPRYDYSSRGDRPRVTGYQATNTITAVVRDLDDLGKVLDSVVEAGGNTINGVSFGLEDPTKEVREARKKAVADALEKANTYAEAAGYTVSRIITIDEHGTGGGPRPEMMAMRAMSASDAAATPIAAGEVTYTASVSVVFELRRVTQP